MDLVTLPLPPPAALRPGWAALAAIAAARGWDDVAATDDEWRFHDGGGNWAVLRFQEEGRAVLLGHDHEYSKTYFGAAAEFFGEPETDLLAGAPAWWSRNLDPAPAGEWIGFVYGWDGERWQRAAYDAEDGFESVGLLQTGDLATLRDYVADVAAPSDAQLQALVDADAAITPALLTPVVGDLDVAAGVAMGRRFLRHGRG